ncbi:MAG: aconitate hydratase [Lysinibacillus fusiformis]|uniref:aconitate hydratase n=1 Tax=Lysinibacillus fusiformis TaxID=28031 RepID=UPI001243E734|nr:aconitate hydratase [Lysinibacillus fusiformis]KAB0443454.1 aconitate hydratase [Lysinibacillus fusiformis]MCT6926806.1 aconitate hydratase [Lysinibacillus fusiformis]MCT6931143.1 aconitate hydratase [Lysinibacillus fusiformis]
MLNPEQRRLFHKFLILEMAVQSLQCDFSVIESLKMSKVYLPILDKLLKDISQDYYNSKRLLAKEKIRLLKVEKIDEYFSDVHIATVGNDVILRYANMALKTRVEKLLISHQNKDQALN